MVGVHLELPDTKKPIFNLCRPVDPDFFDVRVIKVGLKRPITRHQVQDTFAHGGKVSNARQSGAGGAQVIIVDGRIDDSARGFDLVQRVQPAPADLLPHLRFDQPNSVFGYHCGHNSPWGSPEPN